MVPECTESNSSARRWRLLLVVSVCALLTLGWLHVLVSGLHQKRLNLRTVARP